MSKTFSSPSPKVQTASSSDHTHLMNRLAEDLLEAAAHYCEGCELSYPFCDFKVCSAHDARCRALSIRHDLEWAKRANPQAFQKQGEASGEDFSMGERDLLQR
ncbi:MAG: hypothetical protein ACPGOV_03005 [Magnetovibrionaceae bacterium]